jgi:hypothetical protein
MEIDISNMPDSELEKLPVEVDWTLTLPESYPNLIVTADWRQRIYDDTACRFVRWVMKEIRVQISHDNDPPWDSSGEAKRYSPDMKTLLELHETLEDWLTTEYTGEAEASFESGMGWY